MARSTSILPPSPVASLLCPLERTRRIWRQIKLDSAFECTDVPLPSEGACVRIRTPGFVSFLSLTCDQVNLCGHICEVEIKLLIHPSGVLRDMAAKYLEAGT